MSTATLLRLREAVEAPTVGPAPSLRADGTLRFRARIIEGDRWGASAYYPADVVKRDGPALFAQGTHMYADHPTESDRWQRPERSIRDLAATVDSAPVWEANNPAGPGLYADVLVNAAHAPAILAVWEHIGLSVIAAAEAENGEREGRTGWIATKLVPGETGTSVDFVTRAGAGGALVSILESTRAANAVAADPIAKRVSEALPGEMTGNELRDALRTLVRDAWRERDGYASLRDFTDAEVVFEVYHRGRDQLYRQGYAAGEDGALVLSGEPEAVRAVITYVPDPSAPALAAPSTIPVVGAVSESSTSPNTTASTSTPSSTHTGGTTVAQVQIEESELTALREAQAQLAAERERTQIAERALALTNARSEARPLVVAQLAESTILPPASQALVVEAVLASVQVTEAGALDTAALTTATTAARTAKETEVTAVMEAYGITGAPRGVGAGTTPAAQNGGGTTTQLTEADARARILANRGKAPAKA